MLNISFESEKLFSGVSEGFLSFEPNKLYLSVSENYLNKPLTSLKISKESWSFCSLHDSDSEIERYTEYSMSSEYKSRSSRCLCTPWFISSELKSLFLQIIE